jgi:hypothetical protein
MPVIPTLGQVVQLADRHNALEGVQDVAGEQQSAVTDLPAKLKPHQKDQTTIRCILSVLIFISFECFYNNISRYPFT